MSLMPMNQDQYGQPVMQDISRQRKLAEQLRQQEDLNGQMVSGHYVAPSWTQHLARALNPFLGEYVDKKATAKEKDYNTTKSAKIAELLKGMSPQTTQNGVTETSAMPAYEPSQMDRFGSPMQGVQREPVITQTPNMQTETPEQAYARQREKAYQLASEYQGDPTVALAISDMNHMRDRGEVLGDKTADRQYADTREEKIYTRNRGDQVSDREDTQSFTADQNKLSRDQQEALQKAGFTHAEILQIGNQKFQAGQNALSRTQAKELAGANTAPVQVLDPVTGKPVYVNRNDAIGKQPYDANSTAQGTPAQKVNDAKDVLQILKQAAPLINKSTGSGLGAMVDSSAAFFGNTTSGAQNAASLKALEGSLVSKMPKMSGPQSDKDVLLYKQMAGQIGDPTLPPKQKQAAMDTINELNSRYAGVPLEPLDYANTNMQSTGKGTAQHPEDINDLLKKYGGK
jgi:hypothetical protein